MPNSIGLDFDIAYFLLVWLTLNRLVSVFYVNSN